MTNHVHLLVTPETEHSLNARGDENSLVTPHSLYRRLGRHTDTRQSAYRQLFRSQLAKADVDAIREATNKAWVLGNDRFRERVEALSGRRASQQARGRPRNDVNGD